MWILDTTLPRPSRDPRRAALRNQAEGYLALRMYDDALAVVERLRADGESPIYVDYIEGVVRRARGNFARARALLESVIERDPSLIGVYIDLASVYRHEGELDHAISLLSRAIDWHETFGLAWYNLACYRALQGDPGSACGCLARALDTDAGLRRFADNDDDFDTIRDDPAFVQLVDTDEGAPGLL